MPNLKALLQGESGRMSTDGGGDVPCREFCRYDLPRCSACPSAVGAEPICAASEDPMKSAIVHRWIRGISQLSR